LFTTLRIRTKLAIALAIPLVALVASSSLIISGADQRARDASADAEAVAEQVSLATTALGPSGILTSLNSERTAESVALIGLEPSVLGDTRTQDQIRLETDEAVRQFRAAIGTTPESVQLAYRPALESLHRLPVLRTQSDASTDRVIDNTVATTVYDSYTDLINRIFTANTSAADGVDNAELRAGVRFIDELTRYNDATSVSQRAIGGSLTLQGVTTIAQDPETLARVAVIEQMASDRQAALETSSHAFYAELARSYFTTPSVIAARQLSLDAIAGEPIDVAALTGDVNSEATVAFADYLDRGVQRLQADADRISATAQAEADDAARQADLVIAITGAVLIVAIATTLLVSRSITRPLSRLVHAAEDMATTELPGTVKEILETPLGEDVIVPDVARIDDAGGYEITEVATALNTVQQSATDLAVEQAVLRRKIAESFVNLGRRNQALLTRLLNSITHMERNESDPDQLKELFGLAHLATRMRRNAESLVVLAGVETRRQWSTPVPVVDVLRGALGEIEDYERVEIAGLDDAQINGSAVADLSHLVAELLENAINHSPPDEPVEIHGQAGSNGYTLHIIDHGIGMDADELAIANSRVSGRQSFTVAPSQYLGHHVVGLHASKLGLSVHLSDTPAGGTTATIEIGAVIATAPANASLTQTPTSERRSPEPARRPASAPAATPTPADEPARAVRAEGTATATAGTGARTDHHRSVNTDSEVLGRTAPAAVTAQADVDRSPSATPDEADRPTTRSGYRRRVRGTHVPDTNVRSARTAGASRGRAAGAETMRSALSSMHAGMQRSQVDEPDEQPDDEPVEER
jgi:HAMP domain-containing protein